MGDGPGMRVAGSKERIINNYDWDGRVHCTPHPRPRFYPNEDGEVPEQFIFSQVLCTLGSAGADDGVFIAATDGASVNANNFQMSPDTLNGPVQAVGNYFDKYVFRSLRIDFLLEQGANVSGALAGAVADDGSVSDSPSTYLATFQCEKRFRVAQNAGGLSYAWSCSGDRLYYMKDESGNAEDKFAHQYSLHMYPSATPSGATTYGLAVISGVIDFTSRVATQGMTVLRTTEPERLLLCSVYRVLRELGSKEAATPDEIALDFKQVWEVLSAVPFKELLKNHMGSPPPLAHVNRLVPGAPKAVQSMVDKKVRAILAKREATSAKRVKPKPNKAKAKPKQAAKKKRK
jgi:hypothetical protein